MGLKNTRTGWGWLARLLHWVMAVLMLGLLVVGFYMTSLIDLIARFNLTQQHKSFGFVVFVLALIRIVWRLVNRRSPALPPEMPRWQVAASHASHLALYVLMIALPVSGWLMASASPFNDADALLRIPNRVFDLFELPDPFVVGSQILTDFFHAVHEFCAFGLIAILIVHAGAALKHHFKDRDSVLTRMITGR